VIDRFGLLPPAVRANAEREEMVDRQLDSAHALSTALHAMDPQIAGVTYFGDRADPKLNVKPGRWHVWRKNKPPVPDTYIPIETESGGYREPDFGVIAELQRRDTWRRPGLLPQVKRRERFGMPYHEVDPDPSEARAKERETEQRRDEIKSDFEAAKRVAGEGGLKKRKWGKG
jgi:hypothetical protein